MFVNRARARAARPRADARCVRGGARYVDVSYRDQHVRKAMIELGPDEALTHTPEWLQTSARGLRRERVHRDDGRSRARPAQRPRRRARRQRPHEGAERDHPRQMVAREINWTGVAYPNAGWAEQVFGEPDVERLWQAVATCTRLDESDPVAAWRDAHGAPRGACGAAERAPLRRAPLPRPRHRLHDRPAAGCAWMSALFRTAKGREYVAEHADRGDLHDAGCRRAEGTISSTLPLALLGDVVEGLKLTVKDGRITNVEASHGAELVRGQLDSDERARYFGEVALVDGKLAGRADRDHVLRHALRRERDLSHRLRLRHPRELRGRSAAKA